MEKARNLFKVGDCVVCTPWTEDDGYWEDYVYQIKEIKDDNYLMHYLNSLGDTDAGWHFRNFRKATEAETIGYHHYGKPYDSKAIINEEFERAIIIRDLQKELELK